MRVLRIFLAFVDDGFVRQIRPAVDIRDIGANHIERVIRNTGRIRAHVRDQTNAPFLAQLDAFIEPLRKHHGFLDREAKTARRILL